jgi:hypothetical protein
MYQRHSQLQKNNDAIIKGIQGCSKTTTITPQTCFSAAVSAFDTFDDSFIVFLQL